MKNKIFYGILFALMAVFAVSCSDDDYAINTTPLLGDNSVVTGTADVTPVSAIVKGSVSGLDGQAASSYTTGFYYGTAADALTERVAASGGQEFTASISGEPGEVIYYQAFVTLQGRLTYKGDVKSLVLTDATATTGAASNVEANKALLLGSASKYTAESKVGVVISCKSDEEAVRGGVKFEGTTADNFDVTVKGLLPNTTYYYTAYVDLGGGVVYGEVKQFTTPAQQFDVENDLVDLGLSTKWARYNLGTTSETELGGLFGFGDMTGFNTSVDPADYASAMSLRNSSPAVRWSGRQSLLTTVRLVDISSQVLTATLSSCLQLVLALARTSAVWVRKDVISQVQSTQPTISLHRASSSPRVDTHALPLLYIRHWQYALYL